MDHRSTLRLSSPAELSPPPPYATSKPPPPPNELSRAESPLVDAPPPLPMLSPRRSRVIGWPIKPELPPEGSPSPSPSVTKVLSAALPWPFHCIAVLSWPGEDDDADGAANPSPRSNDAFDAVEPIWAAFCSNAVADMTGCGEGA